MRDLRASVSACRDGLRELFMRLGGRGFGRFQAKRIDGFFKDALRIASTKAFGEYMPADLPVCVVAMASWAIEEMSPRGKIGFVLVYKGLGGYRGREFCEDFIAVLRQAGLDIESVVCEVGEIRDRFDSADELFSGVGVMQRRFVCGSKRLYVEAREEFEAAINQQKAQIIAQNKEKILNKARSGAAINVKELFYKYRCICILEGIFDGAGKKEMSADEWAALELAGDFISSIRSALQIAGGADTLGVEFSSAVAQVLAIKPKRGLTPSQVLGTRAFSAANLIDAWGSYLASDIYVDEGAENGGAKISEGVRDGGTAKDGEITPAVRHLEGILDGLIASDLAPTPAQIISLRRAHFDKSHQYALKIVQKEASFALLKGLFSSDILYQIFSPANRMSHLVKGALLPADERAIAIIGVLESEQILQRCGVKKDDFAVVKLAILMAYAGINEIKSSNIFRSFAKKIGLSESAVRLGAILVRNMRLLIDAPNAALIASKTEHLSALNALLAISIAQIKVDDEEYKIASLKEAFNAAAQIFSGGGEVSKKRAAKERLIKKLKQWEGLDSSLKERILKIKSELLFEKYNAQQIAAIAVWASNTSGLDVDFEPTKTGVSVRVVSSGQWNIAGVLGRLGRLEYMEICELWEGATYLRLDFEEGKEPIPKDDIKATVIAGLCEKSVTKYDNIKLKELKIALQTDANTTKITITAPDQKGLMGGILTALNREQIELLSARAQTIRGRVKDWFLVRNDEDLEGKIAAFKRALKAKN